MVGLVCQPQQILEKGIWPILSGFFSECGVPSTCACA